jgi:BirA family biotin operon repressor/biotin-[acetyl-CoA-carboxylase] ligase
LQQATNVILFGRMESGFIGKNFIFLSETPSTNSYASHLLRKVKPAEGTVVMAQHQSNGRGRREKAWIAEPASNLTFSIILKPEFLNSEYYFYLYKIAALACYDGLTEIINNSQHDIKIKWPNDIMLNQKKIAGILIENTFMGSKINSSIIGIGINVNQEKFDEQFNATSLKKIAEKSFDLMPLLINVCKALEKYYLCLHENNFKVIDELYIKSLFGLNENKKYNYHGKLILARVTGINSNGLLKLIAEENQLIECDFGEIELMKGV